MSRLRTTVEADLCFSVRTPDQATVTGQLTGSGSQLELRVSDPAAFAGGADAGGVRSLAAELAGLGLVVRVCDRHGNPLVALGDVRSPWWQRPATRSRHLRVAGVRGLTSAVRGRLRRDDARLPGQGLVPPTTPYPLAPTLLRRPVRRVTTTHDPARGGGPRLVEVPADGIARSAHPVHWLQRDVTTIGSDPSCDLVLSGLAPLHAEVRHDELDEFVLVAHHADVRVHGERVTTKVLRTASRVDLGPRTLTFVREEYADHGRPFGGRIGGELGVQRKQPPRPAVRDD